MLTKEYGYRWPDGKSCGVVVSFDVDGETPYLWRNRRKKSSGFAELEQRSFGPRLGVERILGILRGLGIRGSFFVPALVAELHPEVLPEIVREGHEVGLHGYAHERPNEVGRSGMERIFDRSLQVFERQVGIRPSGYRSPSWELTWDLPVLLEERGLRYDSSLMGFEHPYELGSLVEVPVSWTLDDAVYLLFAGNENDLSAPVSPADLEARWREELEAARRFGTLVMLTLHPWVIGRACAARMLERYLEWLARQPEVWIGTAGELADYHVHSENSGRFHSLAISSKRDYANWEVFE